jgi:hypothetical protein
LKSVLACLGEALEKVGEVIDGRLNKLVCVGIDRVDPDYISWQKSFLDKLQDAAKIIVDRVAYRARDVPSVCLRRLLEIGGDYEQGYSEAVYVLCPCVV